MENSIPRGARLAPELTFRESAFYAWSAAFILGNLALPQLCHLATLGGKVFLPIYFFTLVGAWRRGLQVGLLTAIASPALNCVLFKMPPPDALPVIVVKSVLLAALAAWTARRLKNTKMLLPALAGVVAGYQILGGLFEAARTGSIAAALQDAQLGWPGLLVQIFGGFALLFFFENKSAGGHNPQ